MRWTAMLVLGLVGLTPTPALASVATSAVSSTESLSSAGAQVGISSTKQFPITAQRPDGIPVPMVLGSSPLTGPAVFTPEGELTNWFVELYQDGTLRLVPRGQSQLALALSPNFYEDTDHPSSPGTVPVPAEYVFDRFAFHPGYHDYCTASPNFYVTPELNADFRGACARHDMCMEQAEALGVGIGLCNTDMLLDLREVCESVYLGELDKHRQGCYDTADLYFTTVTLRHLKRL